MKKIFIIAIMILCISGSVFTLTKTGNTCGKKPVVKNALPQPPKTPYITDENWVEVKNPVRFPAKIPVQRIGIGKLHKPNIVRISDDNLLITGLFCDDNLLKMGLFCVKNKDRFFPVLQSKDKGFTWQKIGALPTHAKFVNEPYLQVLKDGALLATAFSDINNKHFCLLHSDNGVEWKPIHSSQPPSLTMLWSRIRNILELSDGSLMTGVSEHSKKNGETFIWRSFDKGKTWDPKLRAYFKGVPKHYRWTILGESFLWQAKSGKIYAIMRVGYNGWPIKGTVSPGDGDYSERMVVFSSSDLGHNWKFVQDLGWYGEYYPSILRLQNGKLLLTFTMRRPFGNNEYPQGMRAVVGKETYDGFEFDMVNDRIMLDTKSEPTMGSGSLSGTIQLSDGTLISVYSYSAVDNKNFTHFSAEVIRWRLPE